MDISKQSPNPFKDDGFKLSSFTRKCCCVAVRMGDTIDLRDTKNPYGPTISYTQDEWSAFILGVKNGEFDV